MNKLFILLLAALMPAATRFCEAPSPSPAEAATRFINSLTARQKQRTVLAFEERSRSEWSYLPASTVARKGIFLKDLDAKQKDLLNGLLMYVWRQ